MPAALAASGPRAPGPADGLPAYPVAIAAITSCTNTSDPALLIAAGLLARKARARLAAAPWVKTSLGPGSPAAASYLRRAGLMDDLSAIGFDIVGYGCTTCIGNSGPLPERVAGPRRLARSGPWPSCRATGTSPAACIRIWSWGSWCRRHL